MTMVQAQLLRFLGELPSALTEGGAVIDHAHLLELHGVGGVGCHVAPICESLATMRNTFL